MHLHVRPHSTAAPKCDHAVFFFFLTRPLGSGETQTVKQVQL